MSVLAIVVVLCTGVILAGRYARRNAVSRFPANALSSLPTSIKVAASALFALLALLFLLSLFVPPNFGSSAIPSAAVWLAQVLISALIVAIVIAVAVRR